MEKVLNKLLFIHYIDTLNKKSFISLTSICSDIQQKHPTFHILTYSDWFVKIQLAENPGKSGEFVGKAHIWSAAASRCRSPRKNRSSSARHSASSTPLL